MTATLLAASLTTNTVVAALFDSLIERLLNRVSNEIPVAIENSLKQYANDSNHNCKRINQHHVLLLNEYKEKENINTNKQNVNDDIYFCNSVLKLVDERLKTLEILQMADLNVSLSHLSDAKHALYMNNTKRFRYFIEQSYLKAREALYKITNLLYKIYCYSLLLFDGFMMFSDFGNNLKDGLCFIKKLLREIQSDHVLNDTLNTSLNSWRWNIFDKTLIGHTILFSTKISSLVRVVTNKIINENHTTITINKINNKKTKDLKELFNEIQNNCTVLKKNEKNQEKESVTLVYTPHNDLDIIPTESDDIINNIDGWIPNIWNGYFFGINDKQQNIIIQPKHYLNLFKIKISNAINSKHNIDNNNLCNLWYCESTNFIYEYIIENKMWLTVTDSLLFDYYYHKKLNIKNTKNINKKFNIKAFNDHFSKYIIENRLVIRQKWSSIHPKLKLLLKDFLTLQSTHKNISTLDLSFNDKLFGLNGTKYICNAINIQNSSIKTLKIAKNDLNFKCLQLFVISLLSLTTNVYSSLTQLNISYNINIEDDSIHLLLNKAIAYKCPHLKKLYMQWTRISDISAKYIVSFYELYPYHCLSELYLNGNKKITSQGAIVLNAILQGILINRQDIMINISDCKINVSQLIRFDKRLICE